MGPAPAVNRTDGANKAPFEQKERTNSWSEQREQTDGANKAPTLGGGDISWFSQWFPVVFAVLVVTGIAFFVCVFIFIFWGSPGQQETVGEAGEDLEASGSLRFT